MKEISPWESMLTFVNGMFWFSVEYVYIGGAFYCIYFICNESAFIQFFVTMISNRILYTKTM